MAPWFNPSFTPCAIRLKAMKAFRDHAEAAESAAARLRSLSGASKHDGQVSSSIRVVCNCSSDPDLADLDRGLSSSWQAQGQMDEEQHRELCEVRLKCSTLAASRPGGLIWERSVPKSPDLDLAARLAEMRIQLEALVAAGSAALGHLEMQASSGTMAVHSLQRKRTFRSGDFQSRVCIIEGV